MVQFDHPSLLPDEFNGTARLLPLPNLVMFPSVMQPLHIHESRYQELLANSLAEDRLIAMAMLASGWEADYEGRPPVMPIVCLGRIVSHSPLEDGRSNILLLGLRRARMIRELPPARSYREAELELLDDHYPQDTAKDRQELGQRLMELFRRMLSTTQAIHEQLDQLAAGKVPLGALTDMVSHTLNIGMAPKQELLAELNVDRRAAKLLEHLEALHRDAADGKRTTFPPPFSVN